jgi:hypothetical protein
LFKLGKQWVLLGTTWVFVSTLGSAKEMLGKLKKHQAKHWEFFFFFWMMEGHQENAKGLWENPRHR